jgi:hypothetical protein
MTEAVIRECARRLNRALGGMLPLDLNAVAGSAALESAARDLAEAGLLRVPVGEQTYVDAATAPPAEANPGAVLPVTYHETETATEVEYDQGLYQAVDEAVRKAAWHSSSSKDHPWVDGYSSDFTGAVLHALHERFVIVPRGDNHG